MDFLGKIQGVQMLQSPWIPMALNSDSPKITHLTVLNREMMAKPCGSLTYNPSWFLDNPLCPSRLKTDVTGCTVFEMVITGQSYSNCLQKESLWLVAAFLKISKGEEAYYSCSLCTRWCSLGYIYIFLHCELIKAVIHSCLNSMKLLSKWT